MEVTVHHCAVVVADIDRGVDFYCKAFGGDVLVPPLRVRGGQALMGGADGSFFTVALVGFGSAAIELFSFEAGAPAWAKRPTQSLVPHVALQVADVTASLGRAERYGATRVWPRVRMVGSRSVIYVSDPDGNTIELIDGPLSALAATLVDIQAGVEVQVNAEAVSDAR